MSNNLVCKQSVVFKRVFSKLLVLNKWKFYLLHKIFMTKYTILKSTEIIQIKIINVLLYKISIKY
jgi:hypothetical protein